MTKPVSHRILVRAPNWIGDQILAYPFFVYLRKVFPKAWIASACVPWVESIQYRNLVDEVLVLPRPVGQGLLSKLDALNLAATEARAKGPWTVGVSLPNSLSAAWYLYRAGAQLRRGYVGDGRGFLLTQKVKPLDKTLKEIRHRSQLYVDLLPERLADPQVKEDLEGFWDWHLGKHEGFIEEERDFGTDYGRELFRPELSWPEAQVIEPPKAAYWVLAPGSNAEARRWPVENFIQLVRLVQKNLGLHCVVLGGAAESELASKIAEDRELKILDWTAQGGVADYWKVFRQARFTVSNDSGLAHVATLCGSPTYVVWGAGDPRRTQPLGPARVRITVNPVECWPCERNQCYLPADRNLQCLKGIGAEQIWKEIENGIRPQKTS